MLRFKRKANAQMVKSVDTLVSGTSARKGVQVRVLFWALKEVILTSFFNLNQLVTFLSKIPAIQKICCQKQH